jgi:hypothetical protein
MAGAAARARKHEPNRLLPQQTHKLGKRFGERTPLPTYDLGRLAQLGADRGFGVRHCVFPKFPDSGCK